MTFLDKVKRFAHDAHDSIGQTRKYGNNDPYWVHTDEVAALVSLFTKDEDVIAAAHLHDVLEDVSPKNPAFSGVDMALMLGAKHAKAGVLVRELTDVYTSDKFPEFNRATRKALEASRLHTISEDAKLIKLIDLFSNTKSIVWHDRSFAKIYLKEKERVLVAMKPYLPLRTRILHSIVWAQLKLAKIYLWIASNTVDKVVNK